MTVSAVGVLVSAVGLPRDPLVLESVPAEVVPSQLVPGDAHVSIAPRPGREVTVTWHVVARPHLIVTSACPLAGPAAGTLFIKPPERVRRSHAALLAE